MASTSPSEPSQSASEGRAPAVHAEAPRASRSWLLARLDAFLSEPLRAASPAELVRYRIMAGASLFLCVSCVLYLLTWPATPTLVSTGISALGYLVTLFLLRRATSPTVPAWVLCGVLTQAFVVSIFVARSPLGGSHSATMLLPALAVYLIGLRAGFIVTLLLIVTLGILQPLHVSTFHTGPLIIPAEHFWILHASAIVSFVGAWGLGALHSTARDAAQASLERTLRELRESESKLSSLFESTDDMICSLDPRGHLIAANSSMRRFFRKYLGRDPFLGEYFFSGATPQRRELWHQRLSQVCGHQYLRFEEEYTFEEARLNLETSLSPIVGEGGHVTGVTLLSRDITSRKEAEARLGEMHRTLVDVSRQAGMAEIATGVLHNVGNTLNSVNISTHVLGDLVRQSRVAGLVKATSLLRDRAADLGTFLTTDPQGQKLPAYLSALSQHLVEEREAMNKELVALGESVDHIKSVINMQQKAARTAGTREQLQVPQLIDEALRLHAVSFERLGIRIEREYATNVPPILVDRHRLLQILINLLSNARHALVESQQQDKRLIIRIHPSSEGQRLRIDVVDNGHGISPENLPRIFTQGFTTKKTGHGFGLHISALAATEMQGRLSCTSPGPGQGATFSLELPLAGEEASS